MSLSSRESNLAQLREALAQTNSEFFMNLKERRALCVKIQDFKEQGGRYSHYDPEREKALFTQLSIELKELSLKELLAFSLVMEDQAMAMAPGSYPTWSQHSHLTEQKKEMYEMINPLLLKTSKPDLFSKLILHPEFTFLKDL
jgi:chorismate mutase